MHNSFTKSLEGRLTILTLPTQCSCNNWDTQLLSVYQTLQYKTGTNASQYVLTFAYIWEAVWYSHDCCAAAAIYSTLLSKVLCLSLNLICRYRELFLHPTSAKPIKVEGQVGRCAWLSFIIRGDWLRYRELGLLLCWNHIREYRWLSLKSCKGMYLFPIIMSNYGRIFHVTHVIQ